VNTFHTLTSNYQDIIDDVAREGGRFIFVGGCVRDILLGIEAKDVDAEVYNLSEKELLKILSRSHVLSLVGKSFGVIKVAGRNLDISLPRHDTKVADGHRGFHVVTQPDLDFATAARRRDLTINSMGYDPLTEEILDPFGGQNDLKNKVLKATDPKTFGEDPLRALRVAQFSARFGMMPDEGLYALLRQQDLSSLSSERVYGEFYKLLLKGQKPSVGLRILAETGLLSYLPTLNLLYESKKGWTEMLQAVDHGAQHIAHQDEEWPLMLSVLCLGLYKLEHPTLKISRSIPHVPKLVGLLLMQLEVARSVKKAVLVLMGHALLPFMMGDNSITPAQLRLVAADLYKDGLTLHQLAWVAHQWGCIHTFRFLEAARQAGALDKAKINPCVQGKHLMEIGLKPGPEFKKILEECFKIQLEKGIYEPHKILDQR
jgi:tRNA nucleotidyltransferase (CCA-adding enzyme)